ncbi:MAG: ribonuclease D [Alphaproteobacteria bacterium GM202ARS2]|nr:ribonuclease D [Alphaproteobacteria bacterium GM202ARS2]
MIQVIESTAELADFCRKAARNDWVVVDTEFMRRQSYRSRLCLVQLATPQGEGVLVDCLAALDLQPLWDMLADDSTLKVLHGPRQDLEIFYQLTSQLPSPLFDTQLASMLCGYEDAMGLTVLVKDLLGVDMDKGDRLSDWSQRPLRLGQQRYALADVVRLAEIYPLVRARLKDYGREEWMDEEMARLSDRRFYASDVDSSWRRLCGVRQDRRFLARLRAACIWREALAEQRDSPRSHVLNDNLLLLILKAPRGEAEHMLRHARKKRPFSDDTIEEFFDALKQADALPLAECPYPEDMRFMDDRQTRCYARLRECLTSICAEKNVSASLVARATHLRLLACGAQREFPFLRGWRYTLFGQDALELVKRR